MENLPKKIMHEAASSEHKSPKEIESDLLNNKTDTIVVAAAVLLAAAAILIGLIYM